MPASLKTAKYYERRRRNTEAARLWRVARRALYEAQPAPPVPPVHDPFAALRAVADMAQQFPDALSTEQQADAVSLCDFSPRTRALIVNPVVQHCSAVHKMGMQAERLMLERVARAKRYVDQLQQHVREKTIAAAHVAPQVEQWDCLRQWCTE